ncbi:MAG: FG-GAP repeat protein [Planctomycetota bacterium]|jgi:hypothetical protein
MTPRTTSPDMTSNRWHFLLLLAGLALLALPAALQAQSWGVVEQKVTAADGAAGDIYGAAVAIDGDLAIVCNEWDDPNGTDSGSVYAYSWNGTNWQFDQKFSPADNQPGDNFGRAVVIQGDLAVVGTHWDDDLGSNSGSAYVYRHNGSQWVEQQKLLASDGQAGDQFGDTISVDGDWLAIGSWQEDQGGANAGAVYMFRSNGSAWVPTQKLIAPDAAANDQFARYISLSGDKVLVGAWKDDAPSFDSGSAYVFRYNGAEWTFEQKLVAPDGASGDYFGWGCALRDDVAVVGAYRDDDLGTDSGATYVYRFNGSSWVFNQKLLPSDGVAYDWFGYTTVLTGNRLVIASMVAPVGTGSGHAYVFKDNGSQFVQQARLDPSDGADQDKFGFHLAASGGLILVGAWRDDDHGSDSGSAYFYRCSYMQPPSTLRDVIRRMGKDLGFNPSKPPGGPVGGPTTTPPTSAPGKCW